MGRNRVLMTGVGVVSPLGVTSAAHFERWRCGQSAVAAPARPIFDGYPPPLEARVAGYNRQAQITSRMLRKLLSPSASMAVGAAGEALANAGIKGDAAILQRCGLYVGSLSLEIDPDTFLPPLRASLSADGQFDISLFARRGMKLLDPLFLVRALPNAGVCGISVEHQVLGPNTNITNGATSGLQAVCLAAAVIARGEVDCALAGGYDTLLGMDSIAEHLIAGRLAHNGHEPAQACRPMEQGRDGYGLGEGAAFVLLEAEAHARQRGAPALAELLGWAQTTDTAGLQSGAEVSGEALEQAARQALRMAGCGPEAVTTVYGDGLGTALDDRREAAALTGLFGERPAAFSAPTSAIGFTGAGSGVFSLVHAALATAQGVAPCLVRPAVPDPDCPVHLVDHVDGEDGLALVWNSEQGIKNAAVLVGRDASPRGMEA
jgi:3-oxoacyl-[acyl-carrier-protein] synthase II